MAIRQMDPRIAKYHDPAPLLYSKRSAAIVAVAVALVLDP